MRSVSVLLVDDNDAFLASVEQFVALDPRLKIVGRATSGREALRQVTRLQPALVLMDVAMPGMSGLEATRQLKTRAEAPRIIVVTGNDDPEYHAAAAAAGADGFIPKAELGAQLAEVVAHLFPPCLDHGPLQTAAPGPRAASCG